MPIRLKHLNTIIGGQRKGYNLYNIGIKHLVLIIIIAITDFCCAFPNGKFIKRCMLHGNEQNLPLNYESELWGKTQHKSIRSGLIPVLITCSYRGLCVFIIIIP